MKKHNNTCLIANSAIHEESGEEIHFQHEFGFARPMWWKDDESFIDRVSTAIWDEISKIETRAETRVEISMDYEIPFGETDEPFIVTCISTHRYL